MLTRAMNGSAAMKASATSRFSACSVAMRAATARGWNAVAVIAPASREAGISTRSRMTLDSSDWPTVRR